MKQPDSSLWTGLLTTPELDHCLHLVTTLKEGNGVLEFGFEVVRVNFEPETNLFKNRVGLVSTRFLRFLSGLILELSVVHDFHYGRFSFRGYLDKIKIVFARKALCDFEFDDSNLFPCRANEPDLGNADALIYSRIGDIYSLCVRLGR